ncbi:MAG: hypothetical protein AAFU60_13605 [Bacteroidota bacterium]
MARTPKTPSEIYIKLVKKEVRFDPEGGGGVALGVRAMVDVLSFDCCQ